MLQNLSIQNFVIVDHIDLCFKPGFTVLTGETGAGKSILIDALELVLGRRADTSQIRHGCKRAEITAQFDASTLPALQAWLQENALEDETGICLLRRIMETNGRSRNFINGHTATLQQLRTAGEWLIDIHGQHAHQLLMQNHKQCELLDTWSGESDLARQVASSYRHWQSLCQQRHSQEQQNEQNTREYELLSWQLQELTALNFSPEEWETLQAEHNQLTHTASLLEIARLSLESLSESEIAVLPQLSTVITRLHSLVNIDKTLEPICSQLQSSQIQLQEAVYELKHYQQHLDIDPRKLQEAEARIAAIHGVARKYRTRPETLPELLEVTRQRLEILENSSNNEALIKAEKSARTDYENLAGKLSQARQHAANQLSGQVTESMQTLAMAGGRFNVAMIPVPSGNLHGLEQIEFQVSAHKDLPLRPLNKIASGGELSRISLAIQAITSKISSIPTLIFDEVDTGIGGRIAEIVGKLLHHLGETRQVISITHLPQVAAKGDHHWCVSKTAGTRDKQLPASHIAELDEAERVEEIARMLGGENLTAATHRHAAEMLDASK
ncbi:DNA repair protein RecN [Nitrosomonas sp. HPC101]|uniref:DNA repair protein RecN n=1 Tax=Nitrosomonas sp. HPC101 TaxID=1658667 RepID=UPI00136EB305|nr:DNA repair protein RecN [Nitrosomonas sp. HPC101]MXS84604.1 DNA repair protein RecN [Nitrosomonas sp. HPC101]